MKDPECRQRQLYIRTYVSALAATTVHCCGIMDALLITCTAVAYYKYLFAVCVWIRY